MKKNVCFFISIALISTIALAIPADNPFEKKTLKKGVNELWQECRKNPESCSRIVVMLRLQDRNEAEWERLNQKIQQGNCGQKNCKLVLKEIGDELGAPLKDILSSGDGIQGRVQTAKDPFGKAAELKMEICCDRYHDKEEWKKVVVAASELAIEGSGEGISPETMKKCGPVVKQALVECCKGDNRYPGSIGAMDDEGNAVFSALSPKKNPFKDH